jgi:formate dehydrogenase subunit gamma
VSVPNVISTAAGSADAGERVLRYTLAERINHWIGALSYIYCLVTGLGFWSPYLYWLTALVGGGPTARFWHPWLGLVFTVSVFWMYEVWGNDLHSSADDRAWWQKVNHYIRNEDEKLPPIGRFNHGQKLYFWLTFYATVLLLLSGLVLWFTESIPWSWRWLRYLSVTVHVAAALVSIGGFVIHVYMSTALVRGSFTAMVRGYVSGAWARFHHRLWYEQVTKQSGPRTVPNGSITSRAREE